MSAVIIDGKEIAKALRAEWKTRAEQLKEKGIQPGLAVIIVGDNQASGIYVRNKVRACNETGIYSEVHEFSESTDQGEVLHCIQELNKNPRIHGILVQLPLPRNFEDKRIIASIGVEKDVDGFHLNNIGALVTGYAVYPPCTPYGVMKMLEKNSIQIEGPHAVVVGRSNIVGKPVAFLLLEKNATVTICHSRTKNLSKITRQADVLIAAIGKPNFVTADMVKDGSVIIDVGINRVEGKLVGDVDYQVVSQKVSLITPVPGGVGPMTIAMLMANTLQSFKNSLT